ncbi:unnamed protein product [Moneuplotes crassus]|uniref:Uncharacterized protein n=1 Tax=Euplotes crassus TaxID=5936 RepID=A0AAD2D2E0_EUPCR|nr:unnamed protein product [Moneuplotes crassus]
MHFYLSQALPSVWVGTTQVFQVVRLVTQLLKILGHCCALCPRMLPMNKRSEMDHQSIMSL